eukprot:m.14118 g.14118  ORF g.14118 m.14118 type:complete len:287 (+) comp4734_c0_seq2:208-1068(+)
MATASVKTFYDKDTGTCTYVVWDAETKDAVVMDTVLSFDLSSGRTSRKAVTPVIEFAKAEGLKVGKILETHVHADHLTAAKVAQEELGGQTGIGANVTEVQKTFKALFNLEDLATDGSQFDLLFKDGDEFKVGNMTCKVVHTPGHTPACVSYIVGGCVFTGDTIFMPDMGSARCDFPGGSADTLYDSAQKLFGLDPSLKVFVGHDYGPGGREPAWETTIEAEKTSNKTVTAETPKEEFVQWRKQRDATLSVPKLLVAAMQVNLRNGSFPEPEANGTRYLKLPVNVL